MKRYILILLLALGSVLTPGPRANAQTVDDVLAGFESGGGYSATEDFLFALAGTGDDRALAIIDTLENGALFVRLSDNRLYAATETADGYDLSDPLSGAPAGAAAYDAVEEVRVNNRIRRAIDAARGALTLRSPKAEERLNAAQMAFQNRNTALLPIVERALAAEKDPEILTALQQAAAALQLETGADEATSLAAIAVLAERGDRPALNYLNETAQNSEGAVQAAATKAAQAIKDQLDMLQQVQKIWYGISLGSVLLLAAIGLAITFGVMGVINMAHGELVMIGAYTTYTVQQLVQAYIPTASDYSVIIAIPVAFLVAGGVGIAIERGIIRFLYGRPLETLLATWGVSLVLQQVIRSIFGPSNVEVSTPSWMTGTLELTAGLPFTMNRLYILLFTLLIFAGLIIAMKRTSFGLKMRAVTQNRPMARAMGIQSGLVDALTFGLGAGLAGLAGVALSQIDNVSPNLGQSYIIDSFLVVVFGGVGNLWGTFLGALTLGIANKFLEPVAGAVLGKIIILIAVILFIQRRPRGLFALRGRFVDA